MFPRLFGNRTALQVAQPRDVSTQVFAPVGAPPLDDDAVHFRDLWHVVLKRKWSLIAFFLLVVVTVGVATTLMTPIFGRRFRSRSSATSPRWWISRT